jgi:hypothetical protein
VVNSITFNLLPFFYYKAIKHLFFWNVRMNNISYYQCQQLNFFRRSATTRSVVFNILVFVCELGGISNNARTIFLLHLVLLYTVYDYFPSIHSSNYTWKMLLRMITELHVNSHVLTSVYLIGFLPRFSLKSRFLIKISRTTFDLSVICLTQVVIWEYH